jgi:hypothetical protein
VSARDLAGISAGSYFFALRRWVFEGVKSEEMLVPAVSRIGTTEVLNDDDGDRLMNAARLLGADWLEAGAVVSAERAAAMLDTLEDHLELEYRHVLKRKHDENSDRAMFQLHGIERHLSTRVAAMQDTKLRHEQLGRSGLAKATQGRIDKLRARLEMRREQVQRRQQLTPSNHFVCCGVVLVEA